MELAAGTGATLAGTISGPWVHQLKAAEPQATGASGALGVNPFQDPAFAAGAKARLQEFAGRGADPDAADAIFRRLTSLDAEP